MGDRHLIEAFALWLEAHAGRVIGVVAAVCAWLCFYGDVPIAGMIILTLAVIAIAGAWDTDTRSEASDG